MPALLIVGMGKGNSKHKGDMMNPMESFLGGKKPEDKVEDKDTDKDAMVESDDSAPAKDGISFNKPAGFKVPDGVKDGESFDAMATIKMVDGKIVLSELDGSPVQDGPEDSDEDSESEDESSESEPEDKPSEEDSDASSSDFLGSIEKGMSKKSPK